MSLAQLLTLDLYLQQVQLMMRTLLPQTAIYIFGMALPGQALVRLLDLLVRQVLDRLVQQVLLVQQARKDLQAQMELLA